MRVLFLGTPDFAVEAFESLIRAGYDVIGAITQPDRKRNRGEVTFVLSRAALSLTALTSINTNLYAKRALKI